MGEKTKNTKQEQKFEHTIKRMLGMPHQPHVQKDQKKGKSSKK